MPGIAYGRRIAVCYAGPHDINGKMVELGWALAYRKYSSDYIDEEDDARGQGVGMWAGEFIEPWKWRGGARLTTESLRSPETTTNSTECKIKGNIGSNGTRIYHTQASPWYSRTKIDESRGERWFCSIEEAIDAGWRAAKY